MKILTANGNPFLNEKLQKFENVEVIGKDIQYQEGIIEILEKNLKIDILIISDNLPGELGFYKLIDKITKLKKDLDIYVFLENKNDDKENYLISKEIYKIFYLNLIDFDVFLENFKEKNTNTQEFINKEINELKNIILNKNSGVENYNFVEKSINENFKQDDNEKIEKLEIQEDIDDECKTIAISGNFGAGKSLISSFLSKVISEQNKKTLLVDFDLENPSLNTIFGVRKYKEKPKYIDDYIFKINDNLDLLCGIEKVVDFKENLSMSIIREILNRLKKEYNFIILDVSTRIDFKYVKVILTYCDKIIFLIEPNLLEISKSNKLIEVIVNDFKIDVDKIKIVFNKTCKYKIVESVLEELFSEFEIIGDIEYEEKFNIFINQDTNIDLDKTKFKKLYEKLVIKKEILYANTSARI